MTRSILDMTRIAITALVLAAGPAAAQTPSTGLPPLIDREIFFGDPEYAGAQISPDGRHVSFLRTNRGQLNIWVKGREEPLSAARPLTADSTRPVTGYFWSQDGKYVLYVQDRGGDENFHVYAVDPTAAAEAATGIPPARDLTPYGKVQAQIVAVPEATPGHVLVALNDRDPAKHDVHRIALATGERELVFTNDENIAGFTEDRDGRLRLGTRVTADGMGSEVLAIEGQSVRPLFTLTCDIFRSCAPLRFHRDGRRVYVVTAAPGEDLTHLALYDLQSGAWEKVESDPEGQVDFGGIDVSDATDEVVLTYYVGDRLRIYPKSAQVEKDLATIRAAVGDGEIRPGASTNDDRLRIINVVSDVDPGATYLYDRASGRVELLFRSRPNLPSEHLARMEPVRYAARDGLEIPAYLTVPKGVEPRDLPVLVMPHGGPWGRDVWGYNGLAQFLANRGYAVLMPNFRGSTGYGGRFLDLGNEQWGTGTMQHDISDGVAWLVERGIADPERVGILGGSYGGYATLAGLAFTPELYAAGVDIVGPSNLATLLSSIPPYWAVIRKTFDVRLGNLDDPEDAARMRAQSPLFSVERIRAPLLVIQGANDPRVTKAEADQIVVAMRERELPVEYLNAPDEGHGYAERVNRIAMFAAIEKFLAAHLGGRYQESLPDEVAQRLAAITVDVDTVRYEPAAAAAGDDAAPVRFAGDAVRAGSHTYAQSVQMGERALEATATVSVTEAAWEGKPAWLFVETTQGAMGSGTDSVYVDRATLAPLRRVVHQGTAVIELTFGADSVTGQIQAGPQQMPIRAATGGPVYMEGSALRAALATLPLEAGQTASIRTFDLMSAAVREQVIRVIGTERVTVGGAEREAVRVEMKPVDGAAGAAGFWIEAGEPHRLLKAEATLPAQAGGGKVRVELTAPES